MLLEYFFEFTFKVSGRFGWHPKRGHLSTAEFFFESLVQNSYNDLRIIPIYFLNFRSRKDISDRGLLNLHIEYFLYLFSSCLSASKTLDIADDGYSIRMAF